MKCLIFFKNIIYKRKEKRSGPLKFLYNGKKYTSNKCALLYKLDCNELWIYLLNQVDKLISKIEKVP